MQGRYSADSTAAQQVDEDVRYIFPISPLHLRCISAISPLYLTAAQQIDEDVRELRPAQARRDVLDGGKHELEVVHRLVEEGAPVLHGVGVRVGVG